MSRAELLALADEMDAAADQARDHARRIRLLADTTCALGGEPLTDTDNLPFCDGGRVCFAHAAEETARS